MYKDLFCNRLAQLRIAKGVSARDMSLSLDQNEGYINNIENKNNLPSMAVFFNICEYFNISPKDFFDVEAKNPEKLNEVINGLKSLDEEQLANISAIIKGLNK